jgi:ABC-type sulfate/molybdate transport systems ATPase subunit
MLQSPTLHLRVNAPIGALHLEADIHLTAPWTVLFGPSGSGKSSLLRLIAGLWTPRDSAIRLNEQDLTHVPEHKRRIALVAQQVALFPNMTVQQNVAFGCKTNPDRATELIQNLGLTALAQAKPATLSGGERQRVALARALAPAPHYLLLDEVFNGMHTPLRQQLMETLRTGATPILSVTHDVAEALQAGEVIKIENGRIIVQGPPASVLATERETLLRTLNG